jgi:hypothetical protein
VEPYAWVINQSLLMRSGLKDPLLKSRARQEAVIFKEIQQSHSRHVFGIPFLPSEALLPALLNESGRKDQAGSQIPSTASEFV